MTVAKRDVLRLFVSLKYVTANAVDRQCGRIVTTASTAERPLRDGLGCGRACNARALAVIGEVLAMRLKVDGLAREPIYANAETKPRSGPSSTRCAATGSTSASTTMATTDCTS
jgi:ribosomal protein L18